jgi:hypothetical protein
MHASSRRTFGKTAVFVLAMQFCFDKLPNVPVLSPESKLQKTISVFCGPQGL